MEENDERNEIIDVFRGIAIIDMILVHFVKYFPKNIYKLIIYTDIAVEIYIIITGFMVGLHYYPKYKQKKTEVTKRLLQRAWQIILIQQMMVLTLNVPAYFLLFESNKNTESFAIFLLKSIFLVNQIQLIHILPTFIPFLIISPIILYAFDKDFTFIVAISSLIIFAIGNIYPYAINIGDKTIFPFILWQVYFVAGCFLGKEVYFRKKIAPKNINKLFFPAIIIVSMAMFVKHAKVVSPTLTSKFPLNALGFFYGSSLIFLLYTIVIKYWSYVKGAKFFYGFTTIIGRHSLLVFCIHVYSAYLLMVVNKYYINTIFNYFFILISLIVIYIVARQQDMRENKLVYQLRC